MAELVRAEALVTACARVSAANGLLRSPKEGMKLDVSRRAGPPLIEYLRTSRAWERADRPRSVCFLRSARGAPAVAGTVVSTDGGAGAGGAGGGGGAVGGGMESDGHADALEALSLVLAKRQLVWVIPQCGKIGEPDPALVMVARLEARDDGSVVLNMIGVPLSELVEEARRRFPATGGFFIFDVDETLLSTKLESELVADILRPGAKEMLAALARAGHTLTVNSNSSPARLERVLRECGIGCVADAPGRVVCACRLT